MCLGGRIHGRCCQQPLQPLPQPVEEREVVVPLTGARGYVKIVDFIAEVTIKQRFENQEQVPIEAVYEIIILLLSRYYDLYWFY